MARQAPKTSTFRTTEKLMLDVQHNARLLGHAALTKNWEIAISVSVHIDDLDRRIQKAYDYAQTLPEPEQTYVKKSLRRLYRGWQMANAAVRGAPPHGAKDRHAHRDAAGLRRGALEMFSAAGDVYSFMHHSRYTGWGGTRGYMATRHEFKRSLRHRRKDVSRSLSAWPAYTDTR